MIVGPLVIHDWVMMLVLILTSGLVALAVILGWAFYATRPVGPLSINTDIDPETEHLIYLVSEMEALAPKARRAAESGVCPEGCEEVQVNKSIDPVHWWMAHLRYHHGESEDDGDE